MNIPFFLLTRYHRSGVAKRRKVKCRIRTSVNCYRDSSKPQGEIDKFNPVAVYQLHVTELSNNPLSISPFTPCRPRKHIFHSFFFFQLSDIYLRTQFEQFLRPTTSQYGRFRQPESNYHVLLQSAYKYTKEIFNQARPERK